MASQRFSTVPAAQRVIATNEKVTGLPAVELIRQSGILNDDSREIKVLDNATGGGVLISELLKQKLNGQVLSIIAGDINEQMLAYTRQRSQVEKWCQKGVNVEVTNINQESPNLPADSIDYAFNNFGVFFSKDDSSVISQTYQLLKPNGISLFASWKSVAWWHSVVLPAMQRHLPGAPQLPDPFALFCAGWNDPSSAASKLTAAGFRNVTSKVYSFTPDVEAATFAEACAVLVGAAAKRSWTDDEFCRFGSNIEDALREYLMEAFPGGKWNGTMLALITMGEK